MPFSVHVDGTDVPARPYSNPIDVNFPVPFGPRPAYLFPFSDQVLYPLTTGAKTIETRLAIDPPRLSHVLALVMRIGAAPLLEHERVRRTLIRHGRHRASKDHTQFALRVDVRRDGRSTFATLVGPQQATAAAAGAAATVRELIEGNVPNPGVWMPEQVIEPLRHFSRLTRHGLTVKIEA